MVTSIGEPTMCIVCYAYGNYADRKMLYLAYRPNYYWRIISGYLLTVAYTYKSTIIVNVNNKI